MREDTEILMASRFDEIAASYDDYAPDWSDVVARSSADSRRLTGRPRIRRRVVFAVAACAIAAVAALAIPWNSSSGPLDDQALAAIGSGPVIHVIGEFPTGVDTVDLSTGTSQPLMETQEVWYSATSALLHTVSRSGSMLVDDTLATPDGTFTPQGIVYDCTWIAAHPAAATKAHVSCNASGNNSSTPQQVPRPAPALDAGLAGFADGYQQALSSGAAHADGSGQVNGRAVDWLVIDTSSGHERVALDSQSHKPILVSNDSGWTMNITTIETTPFVAADFTRPTSSEIAAQPSNGSANDVNDVTLDAAGIAQAMTHAVWAGPVVNGVPLVRAESQQLAASYAHKVLPDEHGVGLELDYGSLAAGNQLDRSKPYIEVRLAPTPTLAAAYMWNALRGAPSAGSMTLSTSKASTAYGPGGTAIPEPGLSLGQLETNGLSVTIQASSPELAIAAAQALRSAAGG